MAVKQYRCFSYHAGRGGSKGWFFDSKLTDSCQAVAMGAVRTLDTYPQTNKLPSHYHRENSLSYL